MNRTLRATYRQLTNHYLREARSCYKSKAYRMAVMATATSAHLGIYFGLLDAGEFVQDDRIPDFSVVINKGRCTSYVDDEVLDEAEWLMHVRNAFAHPEEQIITKSTYVPDKFDAAWYEALEKKFETVKPKESAFMASNTNNLRILRRIATEAIKKTENILFKVLGVYTEESVADWKKSIEQKLGGDVDLEQLL